MRILVVTTPLPTADRPTRLAPLSRQITSLRDLGVDVEVLEVRGVAAIKYLTSWPRLRSLISGVDLVHAHYGFCGWLGRLQFKRPLVVSFMGTDLLGGAPGDGNNRAIAKTVVQLDRWFARTVDSAIVKSKEMADVLKPVPSHVVPNGVDLEHFRPMDRPAARTALGWDLTKRYILFPANPRNLTKGYSLAEAATKIAGKQIGEDLELVALDRVHPDHVPLYMNACEAMIMASYAEGSPNVVKEAMACNLPTVSVPVGDVAELFGNVDGCHVRPRDPQALGNALAHTLCNGRFSTGRAAVKALGLDLRSVAQRIHAIYEDVLATRN